jgi:protein-disulfide isomerase
MEEINMLDVRAESSRFRRYFSPKRIMSTLVFSVILAVIGVFFWRVFGFYQDIRSGVLNPALSYTTNDFTRVASAFAAKAVAAGDGTPELLGPNDAAIGAKNPKITIVEFVDFGCPYTKEVAPIVRAIAKQHEDDVKLVVRHFPIEEIHPGAMLAAEAAGCAGEQGKFWEYYDAVLGMKTALSAEAISAVATSLALDEAQFQRCIDSGYYTNQVKNDLSDGAGAAVSGTPTFFFNGQKVEGSIPFSVFNAIINAMLQS